MIFEKVKEIIMDTINCSEDKITLEANLKDDLGIDSLDSMELMMAVEDACGNRGWRASAMVPRRCSHQYGCPEGRSFPCCRP